MYPAVKPTNLTHDNYGIRGVNTKSRKINNVVVFAEREDWLLADLLKIGECWKPRQQTLLMSWVEQIFWKNSLTLLHFRHLLRDGRLSRTALSHDNIFCEHRHLGEVLDQILTRALKEPSGTVVDDCMVSRSRWSKFQNHDALLARDRG